MIYFDLSDIFVLEPVYLVIGILCIAFLICSFVAAFYLYKYKKNTDNVYNELSGVRVYIIDLKEQDYNYLQVNRISATSIGDGLNGSVTYQSENTFYKQFQHDDLPIIKRWFEDLVSIEKNVPMSKTFYVTFSSNKKTNLVLCEVLYVDKKCRKIYIKTTVLKNSKKKVSEYSTSGIVDPNLPLTFEEAKQLLTKNSFKGFTIGIQLYFIQKGMNISEVSAYITNGLFDILKSFENNDKKFIFDADTATYYVIIPEKCARDKLEIYKSLLTRALHQFLEINGYSNTIGIAYGGVLNRHYRQTPDALFTNVKILADLNAENHSSALTFDNDKLINSVRISNYYTASLIENDLSYYFEPIISLGEKTIKEVGFFVTNFITSKSLSMEELREDCVKESTLDKLFLLPIKKIFENFDIQRINADYHGSGILKLFYPISYLDMPFIQNLSKIYKPYKTDFKLTLCLTESELVKFASSDDFYKNLKSISESFEMQLVLENNISFNLDEQIIKLFSSFAFDITGDELNKNEKLNFYVISKAGKCTKFKKPIIVRGLKSWTDLDLLIDDGFNYFSGSIISTRQDEMIIPIQKKIFEKLYLRKKEK